MKVVCIATSKVRITSEPAAKRFLDEKYAIGQVFRILGRVVSSGPSSSLIDEMKFFVSKYILPIYRRISNSWKSGLVKATQILVRQERNT
jgi:hypothetical protein